VDLKGLLMSTWVYLHFTSTQVYLTVARKVWLVVRILQTSTRGYLQSQHKGHLRATKVHLQGKP
jgi:hypothetical protein